MVKNGEIRSLYNETVQYEYQQNIAHWEVENRVMTYRGLPLAALIFSLLANFSEITAYRIFAIINLLLLAICFFILFKSVRFNKLWFGILILYLANFYALWYNQISILILLILTVALQAIKEGNSKKAGIIVAFLLFKPQLIIVVPLIALMINNKKIFIKYFTASAISVVTINLLLYGFNFIPIYLNFLISTENINMGTVILNNWNLFTFYKILPKYIIVGVSLLLYFGWSVIIYKQTKIQSKLYLFAISILITIVLNVHTMTVDLILLLIPITIIYKEIEMTKGKAKTLNVFTLVLLYVSPFCAFIPDKGQPNIGVYILLATLIGMIGYYRYFLNTSRVV
jgi:hypothetical protein